MSIGFSTDIICTALAKECSKNIIDAVLNEFLPKYEKLSLDYTCPPDDESYSFTSEAEMVQFFIDHHEFAQDFYWNQTQDNPDNIMLGAHLTDDNQLLISLTFNGTRETEKYYYQKLKSFLKTEFIVISYASPAIFKNGEDFKSKYQNVHYDF